MDHRLNLFVTLSQPLLLIIGAPLFSGILKWFKCQLQNRTAPAIWQPYRNLSKLFHKEVLLPTTSSYIFRLVPYGVFSLMVVISMLVPWFSIGNTHIIIADIIVIFGFLALSRLLLALAGMDTGTTFGGMGSSREMLVAVIAEPAIIIIILVVAMTVGSTNLITIISYLVTHNLYLHSSFMLAGLGFVLIAMAETGRIPVDNPSTHLELTMIHEAMVLEYSGRYLALLEWSAQIKLLLFITLLIDMFFPWGIASQLTLSKLGLGIGLFIGKIVFLVMFLSITETALAKLRLFRVTYWLNLGFVLGVLALLVHVIIEVG